MPSRHTVRHVAGPNRASAWPQDLLEIIRTSGLLCLDVARPAWGNARGYLFDEPTMTLYFPIAKKYLTGRDLAGYEVLVWGQPRVLLQGELHAAASTEDQDRQRTLALARGLATEKVDYLLLDQRSHRPRKTRHKLTVHQMAAVPPVTKSR